jgi:hypothetical protein
VILLYEESSSSKGTAIYMLTGHWLKFCSTGDVTISYKFRNDHIEFRAVVMIEYLFGQIPRLFNPVLKILGNIYGRALVSDLEKAGKKIRNYRDHTRAFSPKQLQTIEDYIKLSAK